MPKNREKVAGVRDTGIPCIDVAGGSHYDCCIRGKQTRIIIKGDIKIDYSDCVTTGHETGPQNNSELGNLEIE